MATSVACELGWGSSDGSLLDAPKTRWNTLSSWDLVGGSTPLSNVPGILPTGGNALGVTQAGTPAMKVTVIAGRIAIPSNSGGPAYPIRLASNTDLDIATSHATNPRIDLVIARMIDTGADTSAATIEVLTGTPAASPTRPTLPSGTSHCISIATVAVAANATSIVNANITKATSSSWSTATADARYAVPPGGTVFQTNLLTMSAPIRQGWATQYCPGTPYWDGGQKSFGVSNGADIVPLNSRKLYEVVDAATVQTSSTTPVSVANSGTLTVFGGTRRIRVTATGKFNCNGSADTRWMAARAFLIASGTISGVSGGGTQAHARVWGGASATTISQTSFCISRVFEASAGTFSVQLSLLRVDAGGTGTGDTVQCVDGGLLIEDIGPA